MKMRRSNYHPDSWSAQARRRSGNYFETYRSYMSFADETTVTHWNHESNEEITSPVEDYLTYVISRCMQAPIVRKRIAKRFGRLVRKFNERG